MLSMHHQASKGFTLIEVLIIAPIVILAISAFIAIIVSIAGEVLVTRNATSQTYNASDALNLIEQDVRLTTEFPVTTGALPSPQGRNNNFTGTSAFTSSDNDTLILTTAATDNNPGTSSRNLLYYANQPNPCNITPATGQTYAEANPTIIYNRLFVVTNMYFVKDSALWKRTYVPTYNTTTGSPDQNTLCTSSTRSPWQRNTCSPGYSSSQCQTQDTRLVENVTDVSVKYFATGDGTVDVGPGSAQTASTIEISLVTQSSASGEAASTTMTRRMSKLNKVSPTATTSQWSPLPLNTSITPAWTAYGSPYASAQFIRTSACVVMLKGLIKDGLTTVGTTIGTLPVGYRPAETLLMPVSSRTATGTSGPGLVYINSAGEVQFYSGTNGWLSLDGISFIPNDSANCPTTYTYPTLLNTWTNYDTARRLRYAVDSIGRTHLRGMIVPGNNTFDTQIAALPAAVQPGKYYHFTAGVAGTGYNCYGVQETNGIRARGVSSSYLSIQTMFYPSSFIGWTNLTLNPTWVFYGGATYVTPQYTKAADGIVTLKGLIKDGSTSATGVIATLPAGYRPKERQIFKVTVGTTNCTYGRVDIEPDGDIISNQVSSTWVSLNDIRFVAEQ